LERWPPDPVWSRRPPLRFQLPGLARHGVSDSGGFRQRRRVGAAHTNRWADYTPLYVADGQTSTTRWHIMDKVNRFLNEFTEWARAQSDIEAVALVGSYARNAATETSDVDLVVIVHQPDKYLRSTEWIQRFGQVHRQQIEDYGLLISIRVWYTDGREVEYGITDENWVALPLDEGTQKVIADGMRILYWRMP